MLEDGFLLKSQEQEVEQQDELSSLFLSLSQSRTSLPLPLSLSLTTATRRRRNKRNAFNGVFKLQGIKEEDEVGGNLVFSLLLVRPFLSLQASRMAENEKARKQETRLYETKSVVVLKLGIYETNSTFCRVDA